MARVFGGCLALMAAVVAITPVSAMEPLQRSHTEADLVTSPPVALDLTSEQDYFGASSANREGVAQDPRTPAAPGEKGRVPQGHALVDLSF